MESRYRNGMVNGDIVLELEKIIEALQKELTAMTADRDRFAKLSEEWALKGVRMSHKIMYLSADLDRWKAQCRSPASKPQWGNSTMNFNMETSKPELKIGMFTLSQSCVGREDHVSIYLEDGEGGEFKISELEKVIKKFYEENF